MATESVEPDTGVLAAPTGTVDAESRRQLGAAQDVRIPRLLLVALACGLGFALLSVLVVSYWQPLWELNRAIDDSLHPLALDSQAGVTVGLWLQTLGNAGALVIAVLITIACLVAHRRYAALFMAASALGGVILNNVFKRLFEVERPEWAVPVDIETSFSYPSGHAMSSVYVFCVAAILSWALVRRPVGAIVAGILLVVAVLITLSRLYLGVHWPSDIVGGWLLAWAWVAVVGAFILWLYRRNHPVTRLTAASPTDR